LVSVFLNFSFSFSIYNRVVDDNCDGNGKGTTMAAMDGDDYNVYGDSDNVLLSMAMAVRTGVPTIAGTG